MAQNGPLGFGEKIILLSLGLGWPRTVHFTLLIKDKGIKIDNDDKAIREIRECIKKLIDNGVKVNNFDEMKEEIMDHIKKI